MIEDFPDYIISSNGDVWCISQRKFMHQSKAVNGYCQVWIKDKTGKSRGISAHRLVAMAYLPMPYFEPDDKVEVNHKDYNKHNNHYSNLEWVTNRANRRHGWGSPYYHDDSIQSKLNDFIDDGVDIDTALFSLIPKKKLYNIQINHSSSTFDS